jgi:hypothetical protein
VKKANKRGKYSSSIKRWRKKDIRKKKT